jgi:hypothetical protein
MLWLGRLCCNRRRVRKGVLAGVAASAILMGAPPAFSQNDGAGMPAADNLLEISGFKSHFSRWVQPQTKEATTRNPQKQRLRTAKAKKPLEAAMPEPAPQPAAPAWPNAQASAGTGTIMPVIVKTVRELAEPEPDAPLVHANELSDLDMAAKPLAAKPLAAKPLAAKPLAPKPLPAKALTAQAESVGITDGRATGDGGDFRESRFAAFAETLNSVVHASWLEALLLAMAGAIAAVTAMRVFARP